MTFKSYPNKGNSVERAWTKGRRKKEKLKETKRSRGGEGGGQKVKLERTVKLVFARFCLLHIPELLQAIIKHREQQPA